MAVRTDIQVLPIYDPRIILIDAPSTEVTIQDLYDTLAAWQDSEVGHSYELPIITAGGKENLGGGVSVAVSATLQNAQLMFQSRPTPVETGTVTTADAGTHLIDSTADFVAAGLLRGDLVYNLTDGSKATILAVATNQLTVHVLEGGTNNDFGLGDSYEAYRIHTCNISGGNLVAVDDVGATINSTINSFGTSIVRTSSSSATLQDLDAIQYASYQNAVWLDVTNSNIGTAYPMGTREYPVNNLADAQAIAIEKGFSTIQILANIVVNSGTDLRGFELIGKSHVATTLLVEASALVENITIRNCNVSGVLDGGTHIADCMVGELTYVNGHIHSSGLYGTLYLDGSDDAVFVNCYTVDQDSPPIVDMGDSGQDLAMPNYSGIVTVRNLSNDTNEIGIGLNAGVVVLDSTITAGTVIISGVGILTNNSTGTTSVNTDGLLNRETISQIAWNEIHVDANHGTSGTTFPLGTNGNPVDNMADARTIAISQGIHLFNVRGDLVLNDTFSGYSFTSSSSSNCSIDLNGQDISLSDFSGIAILGSGVGRIDARSCTFESGYTGLDCQLENCILGGTIIAAAGAVIKTDRCTFPSSTTFDLNGTGSIHLANMSGVVIITNATDSECIITATGSYIFTLTSSITAGLAMIAGIGILTDQSSLGPALIERTLPSTVWEETETDHAASSVGAALLFLRKLNTNRLELAPGDTNNLVLYDDDNETVLRRWHSTDKDGNTITADTGVPVKRIPS